MTAAASIGALPHALRDEGELTRRFAGRRPAIFLDYDGTLTPIVDRPEDAVISQSMRQAVRGLAERCPVCVVSGRDRRVVQKRLFLAVAAALPRIHRAGVASVPRRGPGLAELSARLGLTERLDGLSFPMQFRGTPSGSRSPTAG